MRPMEVSQLIQPLLGEHDTTLGQNLQVISQRPLPHTEHLQQLGVSRHTPIIQVLHNPNPNRMTKRLHGVPKLQRDLHTTH